MKTNPTSPEFLTDVLQPLVTRLANGASDQALRTELLNEVLPWVKQQVATNVRRIPSNADPSNVSSHMHEAAYQAVARLDWEQWQTWPMYLSALIRRAAQDAARNDDYLSRQQRVLRKQFRNSCIAEESRLQRQLFGHERYKIANTVANGRSDLIDVLLIGWHPQEVAQVPDALCEQLSVEESVERNLVEQRVQFWLENELPQSVRKLVVEWLELPRSKVMPQRLEKQIAPYVMSLINGVDSIDALGHFGQLASEQLQGVV
jgi:DNA-directed RNA polymerase specialized sigma subunit